MRKDAEFNRGKIIQAGKMLMQDEGGDVPVERICRKAGVTRGTFYRNFPDRASLYEAVLTQELQEMSSILQREEDPLAFIRLFGEMMMVYDKFLSALPDMADYPEHNNNEAGIVAVIEPSLQRAKDQGMIAHHISGDDILLGCRMVAANWRHDRQPTRHRAMERRLALLMNGIGGAACHRGLDNIAQST